jgi:hypothetical protein
MSWKKGTGSFTKLRRIDWSAITDKKFREKSDIEIAMIIGCSRNAVQFERKRRKIPLVKDRHSYANETPRSKPRKRRTPAEETELSYADDTLNEYGLEP